MSPAMTQSSLSLFSNASNATDGETEDIPEPTPTPSPSPTPTPTPAAPTITSFTPSSPVYDTEGETRTFNITTDQRVNVSWLINGTEVFKQNNVTRSIYTNTSAAIGTWNISAIASSENGTDLQTWVWNVSQVISTPGPTPSPSPIATPTPTPTPSPTPVSNETLADLIISAIYTPPYILKDNETRINITIQNIGTNANASGAFNVTLYVEKESGEGSYENKTKTRILGLGARSSENITFLWIPASIGLYNITVFADSEHEIKELDETNNRGNCTVNVTLDTRIEPHNNADSNSTNNIKNITGKEQLWEVKIVSCPPSVKEGNVTINVSIENMGSQDGSITLNFSYAGMYSGTYLDDTETLFDTKTVHVDAHSTGYIEVIWDARPLLIGPRDNITTNFTIYVDAEGISEYREINVELLNLSITNMSLNPSHPAYNETANVTVTIKNNENETANATLWLYDVNNSVYEIGYSSSEETLTILYPSALNMSIHFFDEITYYEAGPGCWYDIYDKNGNIIRNESRSSSNKKNTEPIDIWTKWGVGDAITIKYYRIETTVKSAVLLGSIPVALNATETKNFTLKYNFSQSGVHKLWVMLSNGNKAHKTVGGTDLTVNISMDEIVLNGDQLNITARIKNIGHENATDFTVYFYNDSLSEPFYNGTKSLEGNSSTTVNATWNATTWNAGKGEKGIDTFNHTIKVEIDPCENIDSDESNNYEERTIQVYKDFAVTTLTIFPDVNISIGGNVTINSTLEYLGNRSCSVNVSFYVNKSGDKKRLINSSILYFNASGKGDLNWTADIDETTNLSGWFTNISVNWTADVGGNCAIIVEVDPDDKIWEVNETNNRMSTSTYINAPDFVLENLLIGPESPIEGNTTNITAIIKNTGDLPVTVNISFYDYTRESMGCVNSVSINQDEKDSEQKLITVKRLEVPSRNNTVAMRVHFDFTNESEKGYLRIYDSKGRLAASFNESFNGWTQWIFRNCTTVEIEKPEGSGGSYVSVNVDKYDYLVAEDEIENENKNKNKTLSLNATDTSNITINWNATPAGKHRIVAIVDPEDAIPEINKTNNVQMSFILVQGPDLVASKIWLLNNTDGTELNATNITAGELVNITANITNIGMLPTNKFNVSFFLNDYDNKIAAIPVLNLSRSPNQAITVSAKWNAAGGNHTIIVKADSENNLFETNESNNIGEICARVLGADLAVLRVNITLNTTAEGDNAIVAVNATIINQGVSPANNFSSFLFFGEEIEHKKFEDKGTQSEEWVNISHAGANSICVHVNATSHLEKGEKIPTIKEGGIKIYNGNEEVAEPTEPCWIPVMGDTVNVSVLHGNGQGVEIFFYAGDINSTENVSLDDDKFELSLMEEVGKGIYTAYAVADAWDNVTEHDETNNFEVKEIKVLPDFMVSNISISVNGTEVREAKEGETVFMNASIANEGLISGVADVEVFVVHDWVDHSPRFELTPFGYPYGYGYVITHPGADAIRIHFKTLSVTNRSSQGKETSGVVYIRDKEGEIVKEWQGGERGTANSSWITSDTVYIYAPTKCDNISESNVVIDKYQWRRRIANFSGMILNANETKDITVEWNPDDAGPHTICVVVDADNSVEEAKETNNELNRSFYVVPCSDPKVVNITFDPPSPVPNDWDQNITITAHVTNNGTRTVNFSVDLWAEKEEEYYYESPHYFTPEGFNKIITTYQEADWIGIHFNEILLCEEGERRRMQVNDERANLNAYFHSFNGENLWAWAKGNYSELKMAEYKSDFDGGNGIVWGCRVDKVAHKIILNHTIASLEPGNSTNVTGELPKMRAGNGSLGYTIYACVDRDNMLFETNESNNGMIKVLNTAIPDLTVSNVTCEGGHSEAVIENIGYAPADNVTVRFIRDVYLDKPLKKSGKSRTYTDTFPKNPPEDAVVMRVHVKKLYVADGGYLNISNGTFWEKYEKNKENFWSSWMGVDSAKYSYVTLGWGNASQRMRFEIDRYEYGVDKPDRPIENFYEGMVREEEVPFTAENEIYNLTVFVDPEDRVEESNEGNNEKEKMMGPDLKFAFPEVAFFDEGGDYIRQDMLTVDKPFRIRVQVENIGCVATENFTVTLYINGSTPNETYFSDPISLLPGMPTSVNFSWEPKKKGFYTVKAVIDESADVRELEESNNIGTPPNGELVKVGEPGYMADEPLLVLPSGEFHGGMYYDIGNSKYICVRRTEQDVDVTVNFENKIPEGATVELARLYLYVWGHADDLNHTGYDLAKLPNIKMNFNGNPKNPVASYEDIPDATCKNWSYTTLCYDVSDYAHPSSELEAMANFTKTDDTMRYGIPGMGLIVVYRKEGAPLIRYYIAEGGDIIMAKNEDYPTGFDYRECTSKIKFDGVADAHLANATLLTVLAPYTIESLYEGEEVADALYFNPGNINNPDPSEMLNLPLLSDTGHWTYVGNSKIALTMESDDEAEGWEYVNVQENNIAAIQSRGSCFFLTNAILNVTYPPDLEPSLEKAPRKVAIGNSYEIPVVINNTGRSDARNFSVNFSVDGVLIEKREVGKVVGSRSTTEYFSWTAPYTPGTVKFKVVVDSDNDVVELINKQHPYGESNNNVTKTVTVGLGELIPPLHLGGGGGGTGGGWGEGTGTSEGAGEGEGSGTTGGTGEEGAVGERGGKAITGYLMKGSAVSSETGGGGDKGEFSMLALLLRLGMLAVAVSLVCVGYWMERRRQKP
jgi:subtilase family serine protease